MINETIQILEDLIQAIKDGDLNRFDDLTYDTEGAYCSGQGLAVIADLEGTRNILEQGGFPMIKHRTILTEDEIANLCVMAEFERHGGRITKEELLEDFSKNQREKAILFIRRFEQAILNALEIEEKKGESK